MHPFSEINQLVSDFQAGSKSPSKLPGYPSITLNDPGRVQEFLKSEFYSQDLEKIASHLWIMSTFSSENINALHRQRVKGREIIVTEECRLHLVWIHNRIFIKPLPRYLLSHSFWKMYLDDASSMLSTKRPDSQHTAIRKAVTGFLRTYRHLIKHESDFHIAQQDNLRLIPKDITWDSFCDFISDLAQIEDTDVSTRYHYGELRLTRLNFYAPLLLRKFHFEQVHSQYGAFFGRLYGPILFVFALVSTILNSMQVVLASEQLVSSTAHWEAMWYISRWFSVVSLLGTAIISLWFGVLWLWIFGDEWVYTFKRRYEKKKKGYSASSC